MIIQYPQLGFCVKNSEFHLRGLSFGPNDFCIANTPANTMGVLSFIKKIHNDSSDTKFFNLLQILAPGLLETNSIEEFGINCNACNHKTLIEWHGLLNKYFDSNTRSRDPFCELLFECLKFAPESSLIKKWMTTDQSLETETRKATFVLEKIFRKIERVFFNFRVNFYIMSGFFFLFSAPKKLRVFAFMSKDENQTFFKVLNSYFDNFRSIAKILPNERENANEASTNEPDTEITSHSLFTRENQLKAKRQIHPDHYQQEDDKRLATELLRYYLEILAAHQKKSDKTKEG